MPKWSLGYGKRNRESQERPKKKKGEKFVVFDRKVTLKNPAESWGGKKKIVHFSCTSGGYGGNKREESTGEKKTGRG